MPRALYVRLSLLMFLQYFAPGAWFVTLGTYAMQSLDYDGGQVGMLYGATAIAALISPFLSGVFADRFFSLEKFLSIIYWLSGLAFLGLTFLEEFDIFYPVFLIFSIILMPSYALSSSMVFHHVPSAERDFSRVRLWGTIGWIASGVLVGFLEVEETVIPLHISAVTYLILGGYCLTLPKTPPPAKLSKFSIRDALGLETLKLLKVPSFAILIAALLLITIPRSFYYVFTNPFLNEIGMTNAAGKMTLGQVTEILVLLALPFFLAKLRMKTILIIGMMMFCIRYFMFAYGNNEGLVWMLYAGILVHGFGYVFTALSVQIYLDRIVPVSMRSSVQGFFHMVTMGLGKLIGSLLVGGIVLKYSLPDGGHDWQSVWLIPAIMAGVVALGFGVLWRRGTGP